MNQELRQELLTMENLDQTVRKKLIDNGELFDKKIGYHPEMKAVHEKNNHRIHEIINQYGWPGFTLVGEDGSKAGWLIVQHAVLDPAFQERCLVLLEQAVDDHEASPWMYALLLDRVLVQQGKKQIYGSQHYVDEQDKLVPYPMDDPDNVDMRRQKVGLEPLAIRTAEMREERNK